VWFCVVVCGSVTLCLRLYVSYVWVLGVCVHVPGCVTLYGLCGSVWILCEFFMCVCGFCVRSVGF